MQSKRNKKILLTISFFFLFYAIMPLAYGATTDSIGNSNININPSTGKMMYFPLETEALDAAKITTSGNLGDFLSSVYNFGVAAAAALAVLMIAWGGIEYMTTEAFFEKSEAKNKIKGALWGLLLVLASYLILWTVNPDILKTTGTFFTGKI